MKKKYVSPLAEFDKLENDGGLLYNSVVKPVVTNGASDNTNKYGENLGGSSYEDNEDDDFPEWGD